MIDRDRMIEIALDRLVEKIGHDRDRTQRILNDLVKNKMGIVETEMIRIEADLILIEIDPKIEGKDDLTETIEKGMRTMRELEG